MDSTFASRLAHARKARKLTLAELAARAQVSTQAIWNYENRPDNSATRTLAFTLGDALQISPRWLATGDEDGSVVSTKDRDAVVQSIGCLEAFLASSAGSPVLVEAALSLLRSTVKPTYPPLVLADEVPLAP